jgi:hypothetical protein
MATGVELLQRLGKVLGDTAVGINGSFDAVASQDLHDAPDAGFAAILAVGEGSVVRLIVAAAVLGGFFEGFEGDKKADGDLGVVGPFDRLGSHTFPFL